MLPTSNKINYKSDLKDATEFLKLFKKLPKESQQFLYGYVQGMLDKQEQDKKTA